MKEYTMKKAVIIGKKIKLINTNNSFRFGELFYCLRADVSYCLCCHGLTVEKYGAALREMRLAIQA